MVIGNTHRRTPSGTTAATRLVALFDASDDTVEMVQRMLGASGFNCLIGCRFADLRNGNVDFAKYIAEQSPDVVIFDISAPFDENWQFVKRLRHHPATVGRGFVLTTSNKQRLDQAVGEDSKAVEIVSKPYDLDQIRDAIEAAHEKCC